jgi:pSer/pThr/pTyr-binding forkhead associated (FHA) protein
MPTTLPSCALMSQTSKDRPSDPDVTVDALPRGARRPGLLKLIVGEPAGAAWSVGDSVTMGSASAENDTTLSVSGPDVAEQHARITRGAAGAFMLEDLGTIGGTYVNDVRVTRRTLMLGDKIRLGPAVVLQFTF